MITVKILTTDKENLERTMNGCAYYGMEVKYNRRTAPYVHATIEEEKVIDLFWLGANLATPKIDTPSAKSTY